LEQEVGARTDFAAKKKSSWDWGNLFKDLMKLQFEKRVENPQRGPQILSLSFNWLVWKVKDNRIKSMSYGKKWGLVRCVKLLESSSNPSFIEISYVLCPALQVMGEKYGMRRPGKWKKESKKAIILWGFGNKKDFWKRLFLEQAMDKNIWIHFLPLRKPILQRHCPPSD